MNVGRRNESELEAIRAVARSGDDKPVLMLNLNRYAEGAGYPQGDLYRRYMSVLEVLLPRVGAEILWRTPRLVSPLVSNPSTRFSQPGIPRIRRSSISRMRRGRRRTFAFGVSV